MTDSSSSFKYQSQLIDVDSHIKRNGMEKCTAHINKTKSSAIADKPRGAL